MHNVNLEKVQDKDATLILDMIRNDESLRKIFGGNLDTQTRISNASYLGLIKDLEKTVGFVMIVDNTKTNNNEIDMGILSEYQRQGYATETLRLLKELVIKQRVKVLAQIKKSNTGAIKTALKTGFKLINEDDIYNYYEIEENKKK